MFWPTILQNETKQHVKFFTKSYPFFILDFGIKRKKKPKGQKALTHPMKKLAFMDGKHTHENFGILHFIILK
jgi:hypothetical protein